MNLRLIMDLSRCHSCHSDYASKVSLQMPLSQACNKTYYTIFKVFTNASLAVFT